jgi:hypothetical protein
MIGNRMAAVRPFRATFWLERKHEKQKAARGGGGHGEREEVPEGAADMWRKTYRSQRDDRSNMWRKSYLHRPHELFGFSKALKKALLFSF